MFNLEPCAECGRMDKVSMTSMKRAMLEKIGYKGPEKPGPLNLSEVQALYAHVMADDKPGSKKPCKK